MLEKKYAKQRELRKSVGFITIPEQLLVGLVSYLNNAKEPRDKKIVGVFEQLLALEGIGPKKMDRPLNKLNRDLRRYVFRPLVAPWYDSYWHSTRWVVHWYSGRPGRKPIAKFAPLDMIFDLARAGLLNRLRRCSHCRNWLYAKSKVQIFCSTKCQQRHFTATEAFKAHRREYMRRWYYQEQLAPKATRKND